MYKRQHPKTSQPPTGDFIRKYENLSTHYKSIISIHIPAKLSGTLQSAKNATKNIDMNITHIDSLCASVGLGLIIKQASEWAKESNDHKLIVRKVKSLIKNTKILQVINDIIYSIKGGRVPKFAGPIAKILKIHPILTNDKEGSLKAESVLFGKKDLHIKWFYDGTLNVSANCLDRHLASKGDQTAIIWEGDNPEEDKKISFKELHIEVCKFANALKALGASKGDRITIYMPMIPEAAVAMLACARIGAIHSVVFGGFSPEALAGRIIDCDSNLIITADEGIRGGKLIPLKANTDEALKSCAMCQTVVVVKRTGGSIDWNEDTDHWYHDIMATAAEDCPPEEMNAEDPLFILYTSGSTGQPKGVMHTSGGYIVYASMTHQYVFDYKPGEIYWCTADVGWVTGHSYILYGPLANGATTLMFEGVPNYPDTSRFWQVCDKHNVSIFYTAPTALRA